ncbi:MAG: hypothetical protein GXY53_05305 [Desulfobulbus sp.]|nr:hypothetical protein [Desulfobulbus sp.]
MKQYCLICCLLLGIAVAHASAEQQPHAAPGRTDHQQQYESVEERRIMESIRDTDSFVTREKENVEDRKKELKRMEAEVDKKIDQLTRLRNEITKLLEQKSEEEEKRVTELARVYEKMTAEKAAAVMGSIDQDLAIAILTKMKTKSAAKILGNMEREKAARLTTGFSTLDKP